MSLVHKYRPTKLSEIIGQKSVVTSLTNAIARNRLHSAYLFAGTRGTGKTSAARALAKSLNCETGLVVEPCNVCHSCKSIESGNSMNVFEIDCATNNGVDFARDLMSKAGFAPMSARYKVYILDEAHNLTKQANESLLKTIEEPGAATIFLLLTTEPQKILKTVESRCQKFIFSQVGELEIANHLNAIVNAENLTIDQDVINAIAQLSDGIVRDAVTLLDQVSLNPDATTADVYALMGKPDTMSLYELASAVSSGNLIEIYTELKTLSKSGIDPLSSLSEIANFVRNGIVCKQSPSSYNLMTCDTTTFKLAGKWAGAIALDKLVDAQVFLRKAEIDFSAAKNPRLFLEATLLELMQIFKVKPVAAAESVVSPVESGNGNGNQKTCMVVNPFRGGAIPQEIVESAANRDNLQAREAYLWQQICKYESMVKLRSSVVGYAWFDGILQIELPAGMERHTELAIQRIQEAQKLGLGMAPGEVRVIIGY